MKTSKSINTKNMSDKEAEISLAVDNLYKICRKYNASMFTRVILNDKKYVGAFCLVKDKSPKQKKDCMFLVGLLGKFIEESSDGKIKLFRAKE